MYFLTKTFPSLSCTATLGCSDLLEFFHSLNDESSSKKKVSFRLERGRKWSGWGIKEDLFATSIKDTLNMDENYNNNMILCWKFWEHSIGSHLIIILPTDTRVRIRKSWLIKYCMAKPSAESFFYSFLGLIRTHIRNFSWKIYPVPHSVVVVLGSFVGKIFFSFWDIFMTDMVINFDEIRTECKKLMLSSFLNEMRFSIAAVMYKASEISHTKF